MCFFGRQRFGCSLYEFRMPLLNGYEATERIRVFEQDLETLDKISHKLNGRIPIFAVSASLIESQHEELQRLGMDGWILKPIDFKRLRVILRGVVDPLQRERDVYHVGSNWEVGGWLVPLFSPATRLSLMCRVGRSSPPPTVQRANGWSAGGPSSHNGPTDGRHGL